MDSAWFIFLIALAVVVVATAAFIFFWRRVRARRYDAPLDVPSSAPLVIVGDSDWQSLTEREKQVARLVVLGETNKQVAQDLGITAQTVGAHLKHIYQKMHLRSRTQLAARLHEIEP